MEKKIVKILPYFEPRMWGGNRLVEKFNYTSDVYPIGEVYNVVALKGHADCIVEGMKLTLSQLYTTYPNWFECDTVELPIRVNLLDPEADLSIQLHPDDAFAKVYNGGRGKPEAWVILDAPKDGYIAFGHTAKTREEFAKKVYKKEFTSLIKYIDVVVGDYLDIPCGTIHAIGKGVLTYNISRNADCTLRVYDYERIDPSTKAKRPLQIEEVIANVNIPDDTKGFIHVPAIKENGCLVTTYWDEPNLYTLKRVKVQKEGIFIHPQFAFYTAVEGSGKIQGIKIKKGETIFVPVGFGSLKIEGTLDLFMASYRNNITCD